MQVTGPDTPAMQCVIDWTGPTGEQLDEGTAQAAYGLMAVHGRAGGEAPIRLGVDYLSTVAGVVATQGALAAALSGLRGRPIAAVTTTVAGAALLAVSQYVAAGSAADPEDTDGREHSNGVPPPFVSADGVRFELETLDPEPWRHLWTSLGVDAKAAGRGWRAFMLRYATAAAPLPAELHAAVRALPFRLLRDTAAAHGVAVQPLRSHAERRADLGPAGRIPAPWSLTPLSETTRPHGAPPPELPLSGLTIVEAGRRIQGPLAGHVLQLLGADVIRIEPAGGDPLRGMPPMIGDCSARFLALNRGKQIVEVDLHSAVGRATVRDLAADADVFLHNWAPGKAASMGLDAEDFATTNPGLVYAYASGWGDARGENPPPGTDFVVQAYAGLADEIRDGNEPAAGSLVTLLDVLGGLVAAEGVLGGLVARERTSRGQRMDSSLLSAAGVLQAPLLERDGPGRRVFGSLDRPLPVADGHVMLRGDTDETAVAVALGTDDLASATRRLRELSRGEALALLRAGGVTAVAVCREPGELAAKPGVGHLLDIDGCAFVRSPWRFAS